MNKIKVRDEEFQLEAPCKNSFLWSVPYTRLDSEGKEHKGAFRFDIRRGSFIDVISNEDLRRKVQALLKQAMGEVASSKSTGFHIKSEKSIKAKKAAS